MPKLLERLVKERDDGLNPKSRTYWLNGKRVSQKVYKEESAKCSSFDSFMTQGMGRGMTHFYSTGRIEE